VCLCGGGGNILQSFMLQSFSSYNPSVTGERPPSPAVCQQPLSSWCEDGAPWEVPDLKTAWLRWGRSVDVSVRKEHQSQPQRPSSWTRIKSVTQIGSMEEKRWWWWWRSSPFSLTGFGRSVHYWDSCAGKKRGGGCCHLAAGGVCVWGLSPCTAPVR